jgi:hypothetical protein
MFRIVHKAQDHVDNSELYINGFYCDVLQKKSSFLQFFLSQGEITLVEIMTNKKQNGGYIVCCIHLP